MGSKAKNHSGNTASCSLESLFNSLQVYVAAAAKSLQSCPTLCDPIDGSLPGSAVPGILQARTLEWGAISFSTAWKWKWKWSSSVVSDSSRPHGLKPTRLLRPRDFPGKSTGVGCHRLLHKYMSGYLISVCLLIPILKKDNILTNSQFYSFIKYSLEEYRNVKKVCTTEQSPKQPLFR